MILRTWVRLEASSGAPGSNSIFFHGGKSTRPGSDVLSSLTEISQFIGREELFDDKVAVLLESVNLLLS